MDRQAPSQPPFICEGATKRLARVNAASGNYILQQFPARPTPVSMGVRPRPRNSEASTWRVGRGRAGNC
eukprot:12574088-Alexandrium_andersonii.AAC.1